MCPDCQSEGWTDVLDQCGSCRSTMLVKRLGEVTCRQCGRVGLPVPAPDAGPVDRSGEVARAALAAEVAGAVDRILGRE